MWQCFWLEPTTRARQALRRFTFAGRDPGRSGACPQHGDWGHDASTAIEDGELAFSPEGYYRPGMAEPDHSDARWPTVCACGYLFQPDDEWQLSVYRLFRAADGREYTIHPGRADIAPAGAMWRADWLEPHMAGPDGMSLEVMLPDGTPWAIDGPSASGGGWTRNGFVPSITVQPSIKSPGYHGFLTSGVLSDDIEGRQEALAERQRQLAERGTA